MKIAVPKGANTCPIDYAYKVANVYSALTFIIDRLGTLHLGNWTFTCNSDFTMYINR
jgi:hypothetical protein